MKKLGLGKRVLACAASAATLLTGTTALSGLTTLGSMAASAASYDNYAKLLQYSMYFYDGNMCGSDVGSASLTGEITATAAMKWTAASTMQATT